MSEGDSTWPLPWRGRKTIGSPASVPRLQRGRRLAPGACDRLVADIFQARQVVDAGPADNAEHGAGHEVSGSHWSGQCSTILRRNNQPLFSGAKHVDMACHERPRQAPIHHRCLPAHECAGDQPGHIRQYQPPPRRRAADHADQHALRDDAPRTDRPYGPRRRARSGPAPVERMALPSRYFEGAARCGSGGARPPHLLHGACHHGDGNPAGALHDRLRRRRHHSLRALCDLRHAGTFRTCGARAGGAARLPARPSRHDRSRAVAGEGDVAGGRGRNAGAAISRVPCSSGNRRCCRRKRSKKCVSAWPVTATRTSKGSSGSSHFAEVISQRSRLRSSARR